MDMIKIFIYISFLRGGLSKDINIKIQLGNMSTELYKAGNMSTILHKACRHDLKMARGLLEASCELGLDINLEDEDGLTAIMTLVETHYGGDNESDMVFRLLATRMSDEGLNKKCSATYGTYQYQTLLFKLASDLIQPRFVIEWYTILLSRVNDDGSGLDLFAKYNYDDEKKTKKYVHVSSRGSFNVVPIEHGNTVMDIIRACGHSYPSEFKNIFQTAFDRITNYRANLAPLLCVSLASTIYVRELQWLIADYILFKR